MSDIDFSRFDGKKSGVMPGSLRYIGIGMLLGAIITSIVVVGYFKYVGGSNATGIQTSLGALGGTTASSSQQDLSKVPVGFGGTFVATGTPKIAYALPELKVTSVMSGSLLAEGTSFDQQKRSYTIHVSSDTKIEKESCTFNPKNGLGSQSCSSVAAAISDIAVGTNITVESAVVLKDTETEVTAKSILIHMPVKLK